MVFGKTEAFHRRQPELRLSWLHLQLILFVSLHTIHEPLHLCRGEHGARAVCRVVADSARCEPEAFFRPKIARLVFIPLCPTQRGSHFSARYPVRPALLCQLVQSGVTSNVTGIKPSPHAISQQRHVALNIKQSAFPSFPQTHAHVRAIRCRDTGSACEDCRQ